MRQWMLSTCPAPMDCVESAPLQPRPLGLPAVLQVCSRLITFSLPKQGAAGPHCVL